MNGPARIGFIIEMLWQRRSKMFTSSQNPLHVAKDTTENNIIYLDGIVENSLWSQINEK